MKVSTRLAFLPVTTDSAVIVHNLYLNCPTYIALIGGDMPTLNDIQRELETLRHDTRRQAVLLMQEGRAVGFLDYKVAHPDLHSATISLLLIEEKLQGQGLGKAAVEQLEAQLSGRMDRLYAVVYGNNEQAKRFWERVGFEHLRDSGPTLSWYVKYLK
ncbi:GNAT family N-acetyltransferase [Meiothermus taiwanensis]|uniref:Ribosomal-protein-alanine acetyltransferase n=2 Tax=Meiothermus taiwanensis TaxID=172827 RepID=A0A399E5R9_9DEIN|nr:GNAT family N-acetyltransferase [Meiothermus taiwanensis]AWR87618.1 GCN5-related N-acetyltransferase [Meiothermus taiwanensis WR-220]KIQ55095.1 GCN5 family acetyltransferase [Meiothermus taiwanensis]KZK16726.1 GCN5 family acetyltransferase [Meiothermus taiwanensis]RIH79278.1 ribosomal-protein-alanine acetyltransferase [Meiothermus taiwanensis]